MPLTLYTSNRLENLEILLFQQIQHAPGDGFFAAREIIVPGAALRQRLTLEYARQFGVCANVQFPFLAHWIWNKIRRVNEQVAEQSPLAAENLVWRLLAALEAEEAGKGSRLGAYLLRSDTRMRFELAQQLAQLFERYATYRPHWLTAWAQGRQPADLAGGDSLVLADARWQGNLWQAIAADLNLSETHPVESFLKAMREDAPLRQRLLPRQLSVFALPAIPPVYLDALNGLAQWIDIDLYSLNPCSEYWFKIAEPRRIAWLKNQGDSLVHNEHALLAAWGQASRSALELLFEETSGKASEAALFLDPTQIADQNGSPSTLARIQRSILRLDPLDGAGLAPDHSLVVHACHGDHRQIQVLHDQLLDLLNNDPSLNIADILVLAPRLDEMADTIKAIFGTATEARRIPFQISGLPLGSENAVARVLAQLLELPDSRFEASRLMSLLEEPLLAAHFAFDAQALEWIRQWIDEAGIRWGRDAADRARHAAPASERHTFVQGLSRLLLGYALPDAQALVAGLLPAGHIEGARAEVLGRFALAVERLAIWVDTLNTPATPEHWCLRLNQLLDEFLRHDSIPGADWQAVRQHINQLGDAWKTAGFDQPLALEIVRLALNDAQSGQANAQGSGVLTFAPLAALRTLPYRILCLLGMNDDFPGDRHAPEFDLIAKVPRKGDRQARQDDRAVFLDALLAARERLLIFFNGRSVRNDEEIPPSVLVAQLFDALGWDRAQHVISHPLQPFSRRYFGPESPEKPLFSYAQEYAEALNQSLAAPTTQTESDAATPDDADEAPPDQQPRFYRPSPSASEPAPHPPEYNASQLKAFFRNPSRHWLKNGLHIDLPQEREDLDDVEPLTLGRSEHRALFQQLFELGMATCQAGLDAETALGYARAGHFMPEGELGLAAFAAVLEQVNAFTRRVRAATESAPLPALAYAFELDLPQGQTVRLAGMLDACRPDGLIRYRPTPASGLDELALWIDHLILCWLRPAGVALHSHHIALDADIHFDPIALEDVKPLLRELIALYTTGSRAPLPFFPRSAFAWAETWHEKTSNSAEQTDPTNPVDDSAADEAALRAARQKWQNWNKDAWSEDKDAWHRMATRGLTDPLTEAVRLDGIELHFTTLARRIYGPILSGPRRKIAP